MTAKPSTRDIDVGPIPFTCTSRRCPLRSRLSPRSAARPSPRIGLKLTPLVTCVHLRHGGGLCPQRFTGEEAHACVRPQVVGVQAEIARDLLVQCQELRPRCANGRDGSRELREDIRPHVLEWGRSLLIDHGTPVTCSRHDIHRVSHGRSMTARPAVTSECDAPGQATGSVGLSDAVQQTLPRGERSAPMRATEEHRVEGRAHREHPRRHARAHRAAAHLNPPLLQPAHQLFAVGPATLLLKA